MKMIAYANLSRFVWLILCRKRLRNLGAVEDWQVEWKWDGIRAQLIIRVETSMLWSRGDESVGHSFPEILEAGKWFPGICVWMVKFLPGEKRVYVLFRVFKKDWGERTGSNDFKREPVRFQAYDLLRLNGKDLRGLSLRRKKEKLERDFLICLQEFPLGLSPLVEGDNGLTSPK